LSGCNTKFIFNPGEYESAKYFSDYLGDEEVHYRQKSQLSSRGSTSSSDQDKTKKLFSPEEMLKLPAGDKKEAWLDGVMDKANELLPSKKADSKQQNQKIQPQKER
jgi:hypothetical protein